MLEFIYEQNAKDKKIYKNNSYAVVSKIAYLIGVPNHIFENEYEPPKIDEFQELEKNKNARIIRNLCIVRTSLERGFKKINNEMRTGLRSLFSMPEVVPSESLTQLTEDGITLSRKPGSKLVDYIVEINRLICDRINNCREIFPSWLNWGYIRELFIMPNGLDERGAKEAATIYYEKLNSYPYKIYLNWNPCDEGNILYCDQKFVTLLYSWHGEEFTDFSKVSDAGEYIKNSIYDFINEGEKVVLAVDCENVDPYKLSATLRGLSAEYTEKILSIILFDDVHTSSGWDLLEKCTDIPVEHIEIERLKENKSLVDIHMSMRVSKEFYENKVDSFLLVSSDSDYWAVISSLSEARFLLMVEREKCSPDLKAALVQHGIFYCYMDDFYSGDFEELKTKALFREINQYLKQAVQINLNTMLNETLRVTRIEMDTAQWQQFYNKYLKTIQIEISNGGEVSLTVRSK